MFLECFVNVWKRNERSKKSAIKQNKSKWFLFRIRYLKYNVKNTRLPCVEWKINEREAKLNQTKQRIRACIFLLRVIKNVRLRSRSKSFNPWRVAGSKTHIKHKQTKFYNNVVWKCLKPNSCNRFNRQDGRIWITNDNDDTSSLNRKLVSISMNTQLWLKTL